MNCHQWTQGTDWYLTGAVQTNGLPWMGLIGSSQRKRSNERPHWNLQIKPTKNKDGALMMQCCVTEGMGCKQLWPQLYRKRIKKKKNKLKHLLEIKGMLHYYGYPRQPSEYSFMFDPKLTIFTWSFHPTLPF